MKTLLSVCTLATILLLSAGQTLAQTEFGIGPIVGLNFGTVSISPDPQFGAGVTQNGRTGIRFGAQAELGFSKMFYIVLEPSYIGKGFGVSGQGGSVTVAVNELEIPLLFKVKFLKGAIRPYAFAGPNIGFVLSATESFSLTGQTVPDQDLKSQTSSTDFAIDFGGGAEWNFTPKIGITLDARYSLGLSNLSNPPAVQGQAASTTTWHANGFQILAGVMFHIM